jgi:hypothetical protein
MTGLAFCLSTRRLPSGCDGAAVVDKEPEISMTFEMYYWNHSNPPREWLERAKTLQSKVSLTKALDQRLGTQALNPRMPCIITSLEITGYKVSNQIPEAELADDDEATRAPSEPDRFRHLRGLCDGCRLQRHPA